MAAFFLGVAALASLWLALSWWAALLALLVLRLVAGRGLGLVPPVQGRLSARGWDGAWSFEHDGACRAVALLHVWHGPVWTTLEFAVPSNTKSLQLTVWRSDVSSTDWRRLRQLAARGVKALPSRITEGQ